MAIYHFSVQIITRSKGSSSVASAAYRAGNKLKDEKTGKIHDYSRKKGIQYSEILVPINAPYWTKDRERLWNEVEIIEKNKNSQVVREINVALPKELSLEEQIILIKDFVKDTFVNNGMVADIAIHDNKKGNPHAHIMLTVRPFDEGGNWAAKSKKEYILDENGEKIKLQSGVYKSRKIDMVDWNKKDNLENWRKMWAIYTNESLEKNGVNEKVDHRSLIEQGSKRIAQIHVGYQANAMEKKGVRSRRGTLNKKIIDDNIKMESI